jgi:hypothetical protein
MKKNKREKEKGNLPSKKQTANCLFCIELRFENKKRKFFSGLFYWPPCLTLALVCLSNGYLLIKSVPYELSMAQSQSPCRHFLNTYVARLSIDYLLSSLLAYSKVWDITKAVSLASKIIISPCVRMRLRLCKYLLAASLYITEIFKLSLKPAYVTKIGGLDLLTIESSH